ncbi:hypothetical protein K1X76_08620 [bacterium]|nr:hypothetical protein [bacterium]
MSELKIHSKETLPPHETASRYVRVGENQFELIEQAAQLTDTQFEALQDVFNFYLGTQNIYSDGPALGQALAHGIGNRPPLKIRVLPIKQLQQRMMADASGYYNPVNNTIVISPDFFIQRKQSETTSIATFINIAGHELRHAIDSLKGSEDNPKRIFAYFSNTNEDVKDSFIHDCSSDPNHKEFVRLSRSHMSHFGILSKSKQDRLDELTQYFNQRSPHGSYSCMNEVEYYAENNLDQDQLDLYLTALEKPDLSDNDLISLFDTILKAGFYDQQGQVNKELVNRLEASLLKRQGRNFVIAISTYTTELSNFVTAGPGQSSDVRPVLEHLLANEKVQTRYTEGADYVLPAGFVRYALDNLEEWDKNKGI